MKLEALQQNWEQLGTHDPLWAVMSHADKRHHGWDVDEFLLTGRDLIEETVDWCRAEGLALPPSTRALDFGCGAGRLTQALRRLFDRAVGVDIASSMIEIARELDREDCDFVLNTRDDLSVFDTESFDLVCSFIVLQHMEPRYAESYLREFARVLAPGGVLVVQVPSEPIAGWKGKVRRVLARPRLQPILNWYRRVAKGREGAMEMYGIPRARVEALLTGAGLRIRAVESCTSAGPTWNSYRYLAVKS